MKFIYSWKFSSASARALSETTGYKRIKNEGSKYRPRASKKVINWGCGDLPARLFVAGEDGCCINPSAAVRTAANKILSFRCLEEHDVPCPFFTTEARVARQACEDGETIVVRHKVTGNSGEGIEIVEPGGLVPEAPLYTSYVKKKDEYRVHVMAGTILSVQRKARRENVPDEDVNWKVRNLAGGFIFARNEDREIPDEVMAISVRAVEAMGLDFGAVDVLYNGKKGAFVLEINTAPGLEGTTLEEYGNGFSNLF